MCFKKSKPTIIFYTLKKSEEYFLLSVYFLLCWKPIFFFYDLSLFMVNDQYTFDYFPGNSNSVFYINKSVNSHVSENEWCSEQEGKKVIHVWLLLDSHPPLAKEANTLSRMY